MNLISKINTKTGACTCVMFGRVRAAGPVSVEVTALERLALLAERGVLAVVGRAAQRVRPAECCGGARAPGAAPQRGAARHARPADRATHSADIHTATHAQTTCSRANRVQPRVTPPPFKLILTCKLYYHIGFGFTTNKDIIQYIRIHNNR